MGWRRGRFGCAVCGTEIPFVSGRKVRTVLVRAPGPSTQRVMLVDGREVHRCTVDRPVGARRP